LRCLFGFFLGYLTHWLFRARFSAASGAAANSWWPWVTEGAAVIAIVGFVSAVGDGIATLAAPLVFAAAIYVFAHEAGPVSLLLKSKPVRRLGDWSYSIYMTHLLVITVLLELCRGFEKMAGVHILEPVAGVAGDLFALTLPHAAALADCLTLGYLGAVIVLSALTFRFIEVPGRDFFARHADRLRGAQTVLRWRRVEAAAEP